MGKLRWIRSNYGKSMWILACVLLFGLTGQVAAKDVYESILMWDGANVGSCVAVLDRMDEDVNDLELICGHELADETVVVSIWKRSDVGFILVSYIGPVGNPFNAKATLSEADVHELMLGNLFVSIAPTARDAEPVLGQLGQMDTGDVWAITEMEKDQNMDGWCASTAGRMGNRYQIGCVAPNNPDGGSVMVDSAVAFSLAGTTTLHADVAPWDLAEPCTEGVDWNEWMAGLQTGDASVMVGAVGGDIPVPMFVGDFATFADGAEHSTDIVLTNRHTTTNLSGYFIIRDQDGYPVQSAAFGPLASLATEVAASSGAGVDLFLGTVTVKGDGPAGGVLRYNTPLGPAGVLISTPKKRAAVATIKSATSATGVAIRNPESYT